MAQKGKRVGPRRRRGVQPALLLLALGVTLAMVAWGYLVKAAIDFGAEARGGTSQAWWFLACASLGAVACLFFGLMLLARISRALGLTSPPPKQQPVEDDETVTIETIETIDPVVRPRPVGGHRALR